jgi:hypothetical protein
MKIFREWAMPSKDTFSIGPIRDFVKKYEPENWDSTVDPFAGNSEVAHIRNDLNPKTKAEYHMDAEAFCEMLEEKRLLFDLAIFDPPYSPRQITECYQSVGLDVTTKDTQSACMYKRVRDSLNSIVRLGGAVLSFGWNTVGMGKGRGYRIEEILLVCHGGAHNDTICMAERKVANQTTLFG